MTARHAILPAAAVLVLGVGVYLFVEVRAQPAPPVVPPRPERTAQVEPPPPAPAAGTMQRAVAPHDAAARKPQPEAWQHVQSPAPAAPPAAPAPDADLVGPALEVAMADANRAYDRGDLDEAKQLATRVLMRHPATVRMLRIMVSASCIDGDTPVALASYAKLPAPDQEQMKVRCARYGVVFPDNP